MFPLKQNRSRLERGSGLRGGDGGYPDHPGQEGRDWGVRQGREGDRQCARRGGGRGSGRGTGHSEGVQEEGRGNVDGTREGQSRRGPQAAGMREVGKREWILWEEKER